MEIQSNTQLDNTIINSQGMLMDIIFGVFFILLMFFVLLYVVLSLVTKEYDKQNNGWGTKLFEASWEYPLVFGVFVLFFLLFLLLIILGIIGGIQ